MVFYWRHIFDGAVHVVGHEAARRLAVTPFQRVEDGQVLGVEATPGTGRDAALAPSLDPELVHRTLHLRQQGVARLAGQHRLEAEVQAARLDGLAPLRFRSLKHGAHAKKLASARLATRSTTLSSTAARTSTR